MRKFLSSVCLILLFAATVGAAPSYDCEIVVGTDQNTTTLDPALYQDAASSQVMYNLYETLVRYNGPMTEVLPALAESWTTTDDLKEWTFKLRPGIRFHKTENQDGRELTADDVKFSLERAVKIAPMVRLFMLERVDVIDKYTAKLVLNQPFAALLAVLTDVGAAIVPKEDVDKWGEDFTQHPVGTGPYRLAEWIKDSHMTFERYEDYWNKDEKPYAKKITFRYITNKTALTTALLSNQVHITREVLDPDVAKIRGSAEHDIVTAPPCNVYALYLNSKEGPTADPRVRELFFRAVDVSQISKVLFPGESGIPAYGPMPAGTWGYNPNVKDFYTGYDPARAKEILTELGKKPGELKITIYTSEDDRRKRASIVAQAMLKQIGVEAEVKSLEWGSFMSVASKGKADIYAIGWTWYPDPLFFLYYMFASEKQGSYGNGGGFSDPAVDELLTKAVSVGDQAERTKYYRQAEELIMKQRVFYPLYHLIPMNGINKKIKNFHPATNGTIRLFGPGYSVYLEE